MGILETYSLISYFTEGSNFSEVAMKIYKDFLKIFLKRSPHQAYVTSLQQKAEKHTFCSVKLV